MIKNNVTPISSPSDHSQSVTLEGIVEALKNWRNNKTNFNERIPIAIWDQIFILLETVSQSKIRREAGISSTQFRQAHDEYKRRMGAIDTNPDPTKNPLDVEFCEVKPESPLVYKAAKAFTTTTSVVELYRPDGMLMKIHICTDRFEELLHAFFKA